MSRNLDRLSRPHPLPPHHGGQRAWYCPYCTEIVEDAEAWTFSSIPLPFGHGYAPAHQRCVYVGIIPQHFVGLAMLRYVLDVGWLLPRADIHYRLYAEDLAVCGETVADDSGNWTYDEDAATCPSCRYVNADASRGDPNFEE